MSFTIEQAAPDEPGAARLLGQSHALMQSLFPPEDNFFLDINALKAPDIRFFVAREGDAILGTGALKITPEYGEVKSMFVAQEARGKGIGAALLAQIEATARAENLPALMLETGNTLTAAHKLYAAAGFEPRGPFGDYPNAKSSIFMQKIL
ncbi:MAG: GNAT family N-acetyltransferase [Rhodobacterales bacterium]|nr:MAG: GNAT family N-acetyltransferase [Rhodobacterales bacterium]PIE08549.1 MAG: GNAT family N-acetyltransferase [Rhodobacterales bacterium]